MDGGMSWSELIQCLYAPEDDFDEEVLEIIEKVLDSDECEEVECGVMTKTVSIRDVYNDSEIYALVEVDDDSSYEEIEEGIYEAKRKAQEQYGEDGWCVDDVLGNLPDSWRVIEPYFGEHKVYI